MMKVIWLSAVGNSSSITQSLQTFVVIKIETFRHFFPMMVTLCVCAHTPTHTQALFVCSGSDDDSVEVRSPSCGPVLGPALIPWRMGLRSYGQTPNERHDCWECCAFAHPNKPQPPSRDQSTSACCVLQRSSKNAGDLEQLCLLSFI